MRGGEGLGDLGDDVYETVTELLGSGAGVDVLVDHTLGALTAMRLCEDVPDLTRSLVLEDPPSGGNDPNANAREVEECASRAREDSRTLAREILSENPSWAERDTISSVASLRDCDAGALARFRRDELRGDLVALAGAIPVPMLLLLGDEDLGSALLASERAAAVANMLRQGSIEELEAGHNIHRDDFEGYVGVLGDWLGGAED